MTVDNVTAATLAGNVGKAGGLTMIVVTPDAAVGDGVELYPSRAEFDAAMAEIGYVPDEKGVLSLEEYTSREYIDLRSLVVAMLKLHAQAVGWFESGEMRADELAEVERQITDAILRY